ncbi:MAG TPA: hypothetical protein VKQ07_05200 [Jatrophihabitantaceae bacterium]|nr:hypothetical protein [Jatrophihabitantaceae bacterium]
MRVVVHLSRFYDWVPVPPDVLVTPQDLASGLAMPGREPGTFRMRVEKPGPTYREMHIGEHTILGKILDEKLDVRRSGTVQTRKQAVAHIVGLLLDDGRVAHAQWSWITGIDVHDDGPDVEHAKKHFAPHLTAVHGRHGRVHMTAEEHDAHLAAYSETADVAAHLRSHFGVKTS